MKAATRCGLTVSTKKDEKEAITDEEEDLFWSKGLMGTGSSNSLLNTVYFYNGKLFGLRGGENRNITVRNIRVSDDCLRFEENSSKSFHGGVCDLKYVPRAVTHICHERPVKLMLVVWLKFIDCIWVFVIFLVKWTKHFT